MPFNLTSPQRLLTGALIIAVLYIARHEITHRRELSRLELMAQQQTDAVAVLKRRLPTQASQPSVSRTSFTSPSNEYPKSTVDPVLAPGRGTTLVQSFGQVLEVFRSHGVSCQSAEPGGSEPHNRFAGPSTHRISLVGDFAKVLEALETIEARQPHSMISELTMTRLDSSEPCAWEFSFLFSESAL